MIRADQPCNPSVTVEANIPHAFEGHKPSRRGALPAFPGRSSPESRRCGWASLLRRALLFGGCLIGAAVSARAQSSITLAWTASAGTDIAGYNVYYGEASHTYTTKVSAGDSTTGTISGLTPGVTYYFAVTAYDSVGLESGYSSEITYTVPLGAPTVTLTSPGTGSLYLAPATINLAAGVTANGHTITKVQFYNGATSLGSDTSAPYTYAWKNVTAGSYSVTAQVTYDSGSTVSSPAVTVNVSGPSATSILSFAATSGSLSLPFTILNSTVLQTVLTTLLGGGSATYNFTITNAGYYCVSALVNAPNSGENALYVNMDIQPTDPLMIWDIPKTSGFANEVVSWRGNGNGSPANDEYRQIAFSLSAGSHQLIIRGKDANVALKTIYIYAAPPMLNTSLGANGQVVLTATGQPGQTYDVMACQNFAGWTVIGTVTLNASGSAQFTDPIAGAMSNRLYRLRQH
jgi:hypothetical protein